jgi:hypothetical protein
MSSLASAGFIEGALEKVLSSTTLRSCPGLRRFLEYVVRRALIGDEDRIKEYTIGVEVFDRGSRFDPRCDSIVRVEAHKLREKLREYYCTEGATDLVAIRIPKGAYRAIFDVRETTPGAILDDPANLSGHAAALILQRTAEAVARARWHLQAAIERWPMSPHLHLALASATLAALETELIRVKESGCSAVQHAKQCGAIGHAATRTFMRVSRKCGKRTRVP